MKNLYIALLEVADTNFKVMSLLEIVAQDTTLTTAEYHELFKAIIAKSKAVREVPETIA